MSVLKKDFGCRQDAIITDCFVVLLSIILAFVAQFSFAAVPDSLKKDLEDYDYLVSFVEENYAPFDAIMQRL